MTAEIVGFILLGMVDQAPKTDHAQEAVWQNAVSFFRQFGIEGNFTDAMGRLRQLGWEPELKLFGSVLRIKEKETEELPSRIIKFMRNSQVLEAIAFWNVDSDLYKDESMPDRNILDVTSVGLNDGGDLVIEAMENVDDSVGFIIERGLVIELSNSNAGMHVNEYMTRSPQVSTVLEK